MKISYEIRETVGGEFFYNVLSRANGSIDYEVRLLVWNSLLTIPSPTRTLTLVDYTILQDALERDINENSSNN